MYIYIYIYTYLCVCVCECVCVCMYTYIDVCVGYIYISADVPTRAHDGDGRIVGARNRTHVCSAGGAATCTPISISHANTYIPTYVCIMHTYIYIHIHAFIYIHTYTPSLLRAAIPTLVDTRACACPHVCAHTRTRIGGRRRAQRLAPHRRPGRARLACGGAPPGPERPRIHWTTR